MTEPRWKTAWVRQQKANRQMWCTYDAAVVRAMREAGQTVWVFTPEGIEKGDGKIVPHLGASDREENNARD